MVTAKAISTATMQALPTRAAFTQAAKALIFTLRIIPTLKAALFPVITVKKTNFLPVRSPMKILRTKRNTKQAAMVLALIPVRMQNVKMLA